MIETKLSLISAQLDHVTKLIEYWKGQIERFVCEPILDELKCSVELLEKKRSKIQKEYNKIYSEWLEFSDFLGSLEFE